MALTTPSAWHLRKVFDQCRCKITIWVDLRKSAAISALFNALRRKRVRIILNQKLVEGIAKRRSRGCAAAEADLSCRAVESGLRSIGERSRDLSRNAGYRRTRSAARA